MQARDRPSIALGLQVEAQYVPAEDKIARRAGTVDSALRQNMRGAERAIELRMTREQSLKGLAEPPCTA